MATIQISNQGRISESNSDRDNAARPNLWTRYLSYVDSQDDEYIFWFMTSILVIPCVLMTLSIIVMYWYSSVLEYYIGFAMMLFFVNVLVHLAGMKARVYLPVFHVTALLMILIPAITYCISTI